MAVRYQLLVRRAITRDNEGARKEETPPSLRWDTSTTLNINEHQVRRGGTGSHATVRLIKLLFLSTRDSLVWEKETPHTISDMLSSSRSSRPQSDKRSRDSNPESPVPSNAGKVLATDDQVQRRTVQDALKRCHTMTSTPVVSRQVRPPSPDSSQSTGSSSGSSQESCWTLGRG